MAHDYREIKGAVPISMIDIASGAKSAAIAIVTPLDAQRLLGNNENRKLNNNTVLRYALQMDRGEWDWCDGDSQLKFGAGGVLRNGQHRLNAQLIANVTGVYDIRTGVPEGSYKVMDSGVSRKYADYFYGREYTSDVSALGNRIMYASMGQLEPTASMGSAAGVGGHTIPTRAEVIDFIEQHYDTLVEYVRLARRFRDQHRVGSVAAHACAMYISQHSFEKLDEFVNAYVEGAEGTSITKGTIMRKLVDRNFKPRPHWYGGVTLMAIDAWEQGRGVKKLADKDIKKRYRREVDRFSAETDADVEDSED